LSFKDILLIIISSAGLLHGVLFACYLIIFKKKKTNANLFLGSILIFMAFRIGKSVMLNFGNELEPIFIFAGLAFILLIGPLLRWYLLAMTQDNFKLSKHYFVELIPFSILFLVSFFITKNWFDSNNKQAVVIFGSTLIFIYLHFAFYIFSARRAFVKVKTIHSNELQTKSQKAVLSWIKMLLIGFVVFWTSFFLNIIDDAIPYITGPIMYSVAVYFLSYKAFELRVTDLDGTIFKENDQMELFHKLSTLIADEKLYLEPDISLNRLSKFIGKSPQQTSELINQYAKRNYNDFINFYRVQDAKKMLVDRSTQNFTISSIAFDCGFNSLSSFNTAFKKFESTTPSAFRKKNIE